MWHCKDAFEEGSECVDGVCSDCKLNDKNKGHSCNKCKQKLDNYKYEENEGMMMRKRRTTWAGPASVTCGIYMIVL